MDLEIAMARSHDHLNKGSSVLRILDEAYGTPVPCYE
jgi:hypothetical protein